MEIAGLNLMGDKNFLIFNNVKTSDVGEAIQAGQWPFIANPAPLVCFQFTREMNRVRFTTMKKQNGFTLVELIIGLAIAALVLSLAIPSFTSMIRNNRMTSQVNELVTAFSVARSEAIKRGASIDITSTSSGSSWKDGWVVEVNGAGTDIRTFGAQKGDHTLVADGGESTFTYNSQGFLSTACAANCTISLCVASGEIGRRLSIMPSGHVSVNGSYTCP